MTKTALPYIREIDRNRHRLYDTGIRKNPWGMRKLPALTEAEKGRRNGMTKKKSEEMTREQKVDVREKRAATYEEQIAMIRNKGFILYEDEEKDCIAFLKKVNYYRFSAYFLPYLKEDRSFQRGVSFFRIQRTYEFDSRIRALIFEIIEDVEVSLAYKAVLLYLTEIRSLRASGGRDVHEETQRAELSGKSQILCGAEQKIRLPFKRV